MEEFMAKLTFECNAEDILPDLFNHLDENEIIDTALSVPLLKRRCKKFRISRTGGSLWSPFTSKFRMITF
jgi:hypothetical protein